MTQQEWSTVSRTLDFILKQSGGAQGIQGAPAKKPKKTKKPKKETGEGKQLELF